MAWKKVFGVDLKTYRELGGWRRFGFPEDYERNMENRRALLRGESTEQHWHVQNIRGEHRWLNAFYTPFLDASSGKVDMILGVAHDVTERVLLERQVLDATRQEQQRIANDLYDGLGQELTGIALMLQSLVPSLRDVAPNESQQLETAIALVREAISNTRSIAHGLAPIAAAPGAFIAALRTLARSTQHPDSPAVLVQATGDAQVTVPVELATQRRQTHRDCRGLRRGPLNAGNHRRRQRHRCQPPPVGRAGLADHRLSRRGDRRNSRGCEHRSARHPSAVQVSNAANCAGRALTAQRRNIQPPGPV